MKVCVFGAGAIGGYIAAALTRAGRHEIAVIARGAQLAAMTERGLIVHSAGQHWQTTVHCTGNAAELGPQDLVVVTLKAPTIPTAADALKSLIGPDTSVLFVLNGIPWWYFHRHGGPRDGAQIPALDPGGRIWRAIGPDRVLGGVIYCSSTVIEPGVVRLDYGDVKLDVGEPDGSASQRLKTAIDVMAPVGTVVATGNIRERIWAKLVLNMATGPSALLAQAPLRDVLAQQGMHAEVEAMMHEAMAIAAAAGFPVSLDIAAAVAKIAKSGHKPSILQDLEAGRPMEVGSLYGIPLELGRAAGIAAPKLELLTSLVKARGRSASKGGDSTCAARTTGLGIHSETGTR